MFRDHPLCHTLAPALPFRLRIGVSMAQAYFSAKKMKPWLTTYSPRHSIGSLEAVGAGVHHFTVYIQNHFMNISCPSIWNQTMSFSMARSSDC